MKMVWTQSAVARKSVSATRSRRTRRRGTQHYGAEPTRACGGQVVVDGGRLSKHELGDLEVRPLLGVETMQGLGTRRWCVGRDCIRGRCRCR